MSEHVNFRLNARQRNEPGSRFYVFKEKGYLNGSELRIAATYPLAAGGYSDQISSIHGNALLP